MVRWRVVNRRLLRSSARHAASSGSGRVSGRPASGASNAARRAVAILQGVAGVVSAQLIELARDHADILLAGEVDLIATRDCPNSNYVHFSHDLALAARVASTLSRRHLARLLRQLLPIEGWTAVRPPWSKGRSWWIWEATPGAAVQLLAALESRGVEVDGQLALRAEVH